MNAAYAVPFMAQLMKNATSNTGIRWGDALMKTQQWAAQQGGGYYGDLNRTEQLFGDPAMPALAKSPASGQLPGSSPAPGTTAIGTGPTTGNF